VDDHGLFARTVAMALQARGSTVRTIQPSSNGQVETAVTEEAADLVLLDLELGDGCDATQLVGSLTDVGARVVMVTGVTDPIRRARCIAAGAVGIIDKAGSFDDLLVALDRVLAEGTLLTRQERDEQLASLRAHEREELRRLAPFASLSAREAEVLGELMHGRSVEQVAADAFVSVATVRTQVRSILRKLDAGSQVGAIGRARDAGWTPPQERDVPPR
jgi:two-component system, NarL family, nitrate/nitrite response regulator NarL